MRTFVDEHGLPWQVTELLRLGVAWRQPGEYAPEPTHAVLNFASAQGTFTATAPATFLECADAPELIAVLGKARAARHDPLEPTFRTSRDAFSGISPTSNAFLLSDLRQS